MPTRAPPMSSSLDTDTCIAFRVYGMKMGGGLNPPRTTRDESAWICTTTATSSSVVLTSRC